MPRRESITIKNSAPIKTSKKKNEVVDSHLPQDLNFMKTVERKVIMLRLIRK